MKKLDWTLIAAALVIGALAIGCGETKEADPAPVSATAPADPEPAAEEAAPSEAVAQADQAEEGEDDDEPLVPVDFEEASIETVTTETLEQQVADLEVALAAEDIGGDDEEE